MRSCVCVCVCVCVYVCVCASVCVCVRIHQHLEKPGRARNGKAARYTSDWDYIQSHRLAIANISKHVITQRPLNPETNISPCVIPRRVHMG